MAASKSKKDQNRKARLRKAKGWVATYEGPDILLAYGQRFKVDPICAAKDLEAMKAATEEQRAFRKRRLHELLGATESVQKALNLYNKQRTLIIQIQTAHLR